MMDKNVRKQLIDEISNVIGSQKDEIKESLSVAITDHISKKTPAECLELVKRDSSGSIIQRLPMAADSQYGKALIAFVRDKEFEGRKLDSGLTDATSNVVANVFSEKLGDKADDISSRMIPVIISDQRFVDGLSASLVELYTGALPAQLKRKVAGALSGKLSAALSQAIDTSTAAAVKTSVMKATAASVSSPIGIKITAALVKALSLALKPILLKLLASTAFKAAIVAKLKVVIIGAMLGAFFKIIGVKLGLSAGAVFLWVILPVVIGWLIYEVNVFPNKLAEKVSEGVVADIESNFAQTSRDIADTMIEQVIVEGPALLAKSFVNDEMIAALLDESLREAK